MNTLVLGLNAEVRTDERFLPAIIKQTVEYILRKHDRIDIEILDLMLIKTPSHCSNRAESILYAARETSGYHALFVHSDADDRDYKQTRKELFDPGVALIQQEQADVCRDLIPIIPVRMVEAWMLADPEALQRVLKTTVQVLGLPGKAQLVERDSNPKDTLKFIIQRVYHTNHAIGIELEENYTASLHQK